MKQQVKRYEYDGSPGDVYYRLVLVYDLDHNEWGSVDKLLNKLLGYCDGAGTGFNERDADWAFVDKASGRAALKLAKEAVRGLKGVQLDLYEETVDVTS